MKVTHVTSVHAKNWHVIHQDAWNSLSKDAQDIIRNILERKA